MYGGKYKRSTAHASIMNDNDKGRHQHHSSSSLLLPLSTPMSPYTAMRSGSVPPSASAAASGAVRTENMGEAWPWRPSRSAPPKSPT